MSFTRHVPEARGVLTIECLEDGWRAALRRSGSLDADALPRSSAAEALAALGIDPRARWAQGLVREAERRQAISGTC